MDTRLTKQRLIRQYHILIARLGMTDDEAHDMLDAAYGVRSSKELNTLQLCEICRVLEAQLSPDQKPKPKNRHDQAKTRAKAACGHLLAMQGKIPEKNWGPKEWDTIMGTLYNAAGKRDFNILNTQELVALSFEFNKQRKALEAIHNS